MFKVKKGCQFEDKKKREHAKTKSDNKLRSPVPKDVVISVTQIILKVRNNRNKLFLKLLIVKQQVKRVNRGA